MSTQDIITISQEVSIVFHIAASISFSKPLRYMLSHNSKSVDAIVDFCRKLKKIDVLIFTSTAYSNSNRHQKIEEQIYRLPFPSQRYLDALNDENDDKLNYLISHCFPKWPNNYTFSKCLAENILMDKAADIPTVIIRPSVIVNCWKGILPGYVEEGSGMVDLCLGVGKGFVRVIPADPNVQIDVIPVDVVANAHVVAAWKVATSRSQSPWVVNCTASDVTNIKLQNYGNCLLNMSFKHPIPKSFQRAKVTYQTNCMVYWLIAAFEHYAPAYVIDAILQLTGRKPKLVRLYRFYDLAMANVTYFVTREWKFETQNFRRLSELLPEDKEMFYTDVTGFDANAMAEVLPGGAPFYQWDIDSKNIGERKRVTQVRTMMTTSIKFAVMVCVISLFYAITKLFLLAIIY